MQRPCPKSRQLAHLEQLQSVRLKRIPIRRAITVAGAVVLVSGCAGTTCCITSTQETEDSIRYVVIGFGVISIPKPKTSDGILATRMQATGLMLSNQPGLQFALGYSSSSLVAVPGNTNNAIVEVRTCGPDVGISVNAKSSASP